jgi:hypothetical protein
VKKLLRLVATGFLLVLGQNTLTVGPARSQAAAPPSTVPALYFYPPALLTPDGTLVSSPLTLKAEQITTLFPTVREMSGVVVIVPWGLLCPVSTQCNFSIIDDVLRYWAARGKRVVLSLTTIGPPFKIVSGGQATFASETPNWVLQGVETYPSPGAATLGLIPGLAVQNGASHIDTVYPNFRDSRFVSASASIIRELGNRYDGNATLSYVRIGTGKLGEENPMPPEGAGAAAVQRIPGFSIQGWIQYCEQMTNAYQSAFHRTQLEFDLTYLPNVSERNTLARPAIDDFVKYLRDHNIFLAYDGLKSEDFALLQDAYGPSSVPGRQVLHYLMQAKQQGKRIGLEEASPMINPHMQDVSAIAGTVNTVRPDRLVLFGLDAGVINFVREGSNPTNATTQQFMSKQKQTIEEIGQLDQQLLKLIGY